MYRVRDGVSEHNEIAAGCCWKLALAEWLGVSAVEQRLAGCWKLALAVVATGCCWKLALAVASGCGCTLALAVDVCDARMRKQTSQET